MRLLLIWLLFVQAHVPPSADLPSGKVVEFTNEGAEFETQDDCEAYAASKVDELLGMKYSSGRPVTFPQGTTATHSCKPK